MKDTVVFPLYFFEERFWCFIRELTACVLLYSVSRGIIIYHVCGISIWKMSDFIIIYHL